MGFFFFLGLSFVSFSFFSISMLIISIEEFLPSFGVSVFFYSFLFSLTLLPPSYLLLFPNLYLWYFSTFLPPFQAWFSLFTSPFLHFWYLCLPLSSFFFFFFFSSLLYLLPSPFNPSPVSFPPLCVCVCNTLPLKVRPVLFGSVG